MKRTNLYPILGALCLLMIFSIACNQSGEILSPAEATQRYEASQVDDAGDYVGEAVDAAYGIGSTAKLTADAYLVGLFQEAGAEVAITYATRGDKVKIVSSIAIGDVVWYKVETTAGNGWVPDINLEPAE